LYLTIEEFTPDTNIDIDRVAAAGTLFRAALLLYVIACA
jgi:hypothetical protein